MCLLNKNYFFIFFFIFLYSVDASYLGTFEFDVLDNGSILVNGSTNYAEFDKESITDITSKTKDFWLIDINTPVFENFYYSFLLPQNTEINHISSVNKIRITNKDNRTNIIAIGKNEPIQIKIQYSFVSDNFISKKSNWLYFFILFVFLSVSVFFYVYINKNKKSKPKTNNIILSDLNNRQKEIIIILKKEKIVTQKYLLEKLKIPKGSLSRNLKSLEAKELIEIKKFGLTNKIKLK